MGWQASPGSLPVARSVDSDGACQAWGGALQDFSHISSHQLTQFPIAAVATAGDAQRQGMLAVRGPNCKLPQAALCQAPGRCPTHLPPNPCTQTCPPTRSPPDCL